jgi:uncharacterized protein
MKRRFFLLLAICLLLAITVPHLAALAAPDYNEANAAINGHVVDDADLLSDYEESQLEAQISDVVARYNCDVVIVTTYSTGGASPEAYADDYFDYNGYGLGANRDGVLLLVSMEYSDWHISTRGFGIKAFTDWGIQYIGGEITPYMSDGDFYSAFGYFVSLADTFLYQASTDAPYDVGNGGGGDLIYTEPEPMSVTAKVALAALIGLVAALIVTLVMKSKLKTVRAQQLAHDYVRPGSFVVTGGAELFLYHTVSRTAIPQHEDSGGGGGGSSTHISSSGATHGGGGGHF